MTYDPYGYGNVPASPDPTAAFRGEIASLRADIDRKLNNAANHIRRRDDVLDGVAKKLAEINGAVDAIKGMRVGGFDDSPGVKRIENIPGRRVPYTLLVDIPVGANVTSIQQASVTISQEGPFVAVSRMATFMSALEAQVTNPSTGAVSRFAGRSFGRYRPIHSAWDLNDSKLTNLDPAGWVQTILLGLGGSFPPGFNISSGVPGAVSAMSGFRSMQFDGRIQVINAGSSYPRQNIPVPSSMWSKSINEGVPLGALDFFERGEVISIQVAPNHVNNPSSGNVDGNMIFGSIFGSSTATSWPFLAGQYDAHEGIATPTVVNTSEEEQSITITSDPVTRLPDGILTIGWEGYRIIQPVAP
jgi:hypothetical protein